MKKNNFTKTLFITLFLLGMNYISYSNYIIKVLDFDTKKTISNVRYKIGNNNNYSDSLGKIVLENIDDKFIYVNISHISYNKLTLNIKELKEENIVYLEKKIINFFPIDVISLKTTNNKLQKIELSYEDKMHHDGGYILKHLPVVSTIKKGGNYGLDPVIRGFKYEQLNITLDGVQSVSAACPNRMDPPTSQISPNIIEKIEIIKGPASLRYGTGIGGSINFIKKNINFSQNKPTIDFNISSKYRSNGKDFFSNGYFVLSTKKVILETTTSHSFSNNNYKSGDNFEIPSRFSRTNIGIGLKIKSNKKNSLRFFVSKNIASDTDFPALPMDLRKDNTWLINSSYDINLNNKLKKITTTIYASYVNHKMDNLLKNLNPRMMNAKTDAETLNIGGRTEFMFNFNKLQSYFGIDYRTERIDGTRTREMVMGINKGKVIKDSPWQKSFINKIGVFSQNSFYFNKNTDIIFSLRINSNYAKSKDIQDKFSKINNDNDRTQINPSISIGVKKRIEKANITLNLSRVQRSASISEMFINFFPIGVAPYEMVGNINLKQEVNNQVDLDFTLSSKKFFLNTSAFFSYLKNNISSVIDTTLNTTMPSAPGVRRFININKSILYGGEFSFKFRYNKFISHTFNTSIVFGQNEQINEPLPEIPPIVLKNMLDFYIFKNFVFNIDALYNGKQERISKEFGETETPSFILFNISTDYLIKKHIKIKLEIENILNKNYYEHLSRAVRGLNNTPIYERGRSINFSIQYIFK